MTEAKQLSNQEKIDKAYAVAYENEAKYGSCPPCLIAGIQAAFGEMDDEKFKTIFQASHVLAGGGGLTRKGTCGALVGGMMILSAKYGRSFENYGNGLYIDSFAMAKQLMDRFTEYYGSPICENVQAKVLGRSYDLWDPKEYAAFEEAGGHVDKCTSVVGNTAKWTAEMLIELEEREAAK